MQEEDQESYIEYKRVMQLSQVDQPMEPGAGRKPVYSPLKWYYTQWAWGKICSFLQPMVGHQFSGSEVFPRIWISDHASVCNLQALQDRGIRHIVCAVLGVQPMFPKHIEYTNLPLRDTSDEDIYKYFDTVAELIHNTLEGDGSILVHCRCGVSRSVTLVCAYLIRYQNMSCAEAIRTIQMRRPVANPIRAFRHQLRSYEHNKHMRAQ